MCAHVPTFPSPIPDLHFHPRPKNRPPPRLPETRSVAPLSIRESCRKRWPVRSLFLPFSKSRGNVRRIRRKGESSITIRNIESSSQETRDVFPAAVSSSSSSSSSRPMQIRGLDSGQTRLEITSREIPPVPQGKGGLSRIRGGRRNERARQLTDVSRDVRRMWAERFIAP